MSKHGTYNAESVSSVVIAGIRGNADMMALDYLLLLLLLRLPPIHI